MILVDTSAWVHHLRRHDAQVNTLLQQNLVVTHPFVIGELACGHAMHSHALHSMLQRLPLLAEVTHGEAMHFLHQRNLAGQGVGWIDIHLLASAAVSHARVFSRDKALARCARVVGLATAD